MDFEKFWNYYAEVIIKKVCNPGLANQYEAKDLFKRAWESGWNNCLYEFGIWKDGKQVIGCMETDIKELFK